jgi:hypothetical protein
MEDAAHLMVEFMRRSLVLQASILDWDTFDPFSVHEDFWDLVRCRRQPT